MNQVSENPVKNRDKLSMSLIVITSLMVMLYLTSNIMAVKIISVGKISIFDAGTITYPFTYMLGDILVEIWGYKTSKKVIILTLICNILFVAFTALGTVLPYHEYSAVTSEAYAVVFGYVPRIIAGSLIAFLIGELSNSYLMVKIKSMTGGKHFWMRTIGSSAVGHLLDTVIFVLIAFAGTVPAKDLFSMIVIQYFAKLIIESISGTPLAYAVVKKITQSI